MYGRSSGYRTSYGRLSRPALPRSYGSSVYGSSALGGSSGLRSGRKRPQYDAVAQRSRASGSTSRSDPYSYKDTSLARLRGASRGSTSRGRVRGTVDSGVPRLSRDVRTRMRITDATSRAAAASDRDGNPVSRFMKRSLASDRRARYVSSDSSDDESNAGISARKKRSARGVGRVRSPVGLSNLGNTCFMNSALQCLCSTPDLVRYFGSGRWRRELNPRSKMKGRLAQAFGNLIERVTRGAPGSSERPSSLKSVVASLAPQFAGYRQHDCHEFIRFLLDGLHDELNRIRVAPKYESIEDGECDSDQVKSTRWWSNYTRRNDSQLVDIFVGQLKSSVCCSHCGGTSIVFDPFWDLSLPIPRKHSRRLRYGGYGGYGGGISSRYDGGTGEGCTVYSCFKEFTKTEKIDEYFCKTCKRQRKSTKTLCVYRFPRTLVLHLKRFSFNGYSRSKLNIDVQCPRTIDLQRYADKGVASGSCVYELYAVANHMGGCAGGHYVAHANIASPEQGLDWRCFNDSRVSGKLSGSAGLGSSAYVLFYRRTGAKTAAASRI